MRHSSPSTGSYRNPGAALAGTRIPGLGVLQHADVTVTAGMNYLFRVVHGKSGKRPYSALQAGASVSGVPTRRA